MAKYSLEDIQPAYNVVLPNVTITNGRNKAARALNAQLNIKNKNEQAIKQSIAKVPKEKGLEGVYPELLLLGKGKYSGDLIEDVIGDVIGKGINKIISPFVYRKGLTTMNNMLDALTDNNVKASKAVTSNKPRLSLTYSPAAPVRTQTTPIVHPSSGKVIKLGDSEYNKNRAFIAKFNKWNKRYGYEPISTELAEQSDKLDEAVKDRLLQHNTFLRGVFIDENNPGYELMKAKLIDEGIEPTNDNILQALATRFIPEVGVHGGRAGFYAIPASKQYKGALYTSNGLDQAAGYARRNGRRTYQGVFKVRRPISFDGTRENWVLNAEFPFANSKESTTYYSYVLPYLMKYGIVPTTRVFDEHSFNDYMRRWAKNVVAADRHQKDGTEFLEEIGIIAEANLGKINFRKGTPFDTLRNNTIHRMIRDRLDKYFKFKNDKFNAEQDALLGIPIPDKFKEPLPPEPSYNDIIDDLSKFVNSKRFNDNMYKFYRTYKDAATKTAMRKSLKLLDEETIRQNIIKEGVTPNKKIDYIGTSEFLRTVSRNKGNAFQHFIFAGKPYEKGLDVVERVPYKLWKDVKGSTSHYGHWYPGTSRKTKQYGGKISLEDN